MSDITPETDPIVQQREHIKDLESQLAEMREQTDLAAVTARENVMLKAGVDVETALGQMFTRAYDGELTVEAVRAQASEIGALTPTSPVPDPQITADETAAGRERAALGADAGPAGQLSDTDPVQTAWQQRDADLKRGMPRDAAAAGVLGAMIAAANNGDTRYAYNPETWKHQQDEALGLR